MAVLQHDVQGNVSASLQTTAHEKPSSRALKPHSSRERSPRGSSVSAASAPSNPRGPDGYVDGCAVVFKDLTAQPHLNGRMGYIRGFDPPSARYMVAVGDSVSEEVVRVMHTNLAISVFGCPIATT